MFEGGEDNMIRGFRPRGFLSFRFGVQLVLVLLAGNVFADPGEAPDLFGPAAAQPRQTALGPQVIDFQPAAININLLRSMTPGDELGLNVSPHDSFIAVVDQVDWRSPDSFSVAGYLQGLEYSLFMFVVEEDAVAGTIRAPTLDRLYELRYAGDGAHLICDIDSSRFLPEADPVPTGEPLLAELPGDGPQSLDEESASGSGNARDRACSKPPPVFDVMIFYTSLARDAAGGTSAIKALCQLAIDENNRIYANSGVSARMRLVYRGWISYDEDGTNQEHLDRLTSPDDGVMDGVHGLRDEYGADFVSLLVDDPQTPGIGWCTANADKAFSIVNWSYITSKFTLSHEIGHNFGCAHNREDAGTDPCNVYSYSFGWHYEGDSGSHHGTLMSYPGTRIPYLSNPSVYFDGYATGVPIGETDEAHNAETITQRRSHCEGFRGTRFETWVDFAALPVGFGTFEFPYDTLAEGAQNIFAVGSDSALPEMWIKTGTTDELLTISKPMRIIPCGGTVAIGVQP